MPTAGQALSLLNQADWRVLQLKLLEYALFKIRRLNWRTGGEVLPKGLSAEDLVIVGRNQMMNIAINDRFQKIQKNSKKLFPWEMIRIMCQILQKLKYL